jgi:hypothetical protein
MAGNTDPNEFDLDAFLDSIDKPQAPTDDEPTAARARRARQRIEQRRKGGGQPDPAPEHITAPLMPPADVPARPPDIEAFSPLAPAQPAERRRLRDRPSMIGQASPSTPPAAKRGRQAAVPRTEGGAGLALPKLNLRQLSLTVYIAAAVVVFVGVVAALALFSRDAPVSFPNGVWLGSEWSYDSRSDVEVAGLVERLKQHRIGTTYAYVAYLKGDNAWSGRRAGENIFEEVQGAVGGFVGQYRIAYPEGQLLGWLGIPNDLDVQAGEPYRINDPAVREEIARMSGRLVNDFGFDGVILNVEPMPERDSAAFIALLQAVRREMGEDGRLAVTMFADIAPSDMTVPRNQRARETNAVAEYSRDFKQRVALLTDEIMVMTYNSSLTTAADYVEWVAYQTQSYAEAVGALESGADVVMGIPTYDDQGTIHLAAVENVPSAIEGVQRGRQRAGERALAITGVAIYAEWTTSADEWRLFEQFWLGG